MAEDVNITTTIRDSVVDLFIYAIFPLPLALLVPPPCLMVHIQFSLIYQVWLHNSVVGNLGFLEYIINTPRQHRVHHGKNRYCIDKNYGALIMVWDRLFGTHQTEKEKILYGVVSPTPKTYDSMILQFGYYRDVWQKFCKVEGFCNKMSALFKGPGWTPGKPRLGDINDVPEVDYTLPKYSHDPYIEDWKKIYIAFHSVIVVLAFYLLGEHPYIVMKWPIGAGQYLLLDTLMWSTRVAHILSMLFWFVYCCKHRSSDTSADNESTEYTVVGKGVKDVESETSSMARRNGYKAIGLIFCLFLVSIPFLLAFMVHQESCNKMFNDMYHTLY
ncbi:unnamed protein product [Medioppia subpectinata]|uniref:Fatty acid hydroxylase domain-containing protein n=1 Tax=Medioppia subpectinata TaxID=1979941 RepID=A0A7R9KXY0_9ACAR|nr:unnamed protein product [Medioppia subpectinata]CAG2111915.1 unnamed protein product [Medioppia subpectinata]